ncbi:MAG: hypothetical protein HYY16_16930 [Planctomycetes bacterium]|nr:hypothetical protein [Planctomycetota bacterium]
MTEASSNKPVQTSDRLDVKGMIREASRRVSVSDLVRLGHKTLAVLSQEKMEELVNQAVKNIVGKYRALAAGLGDVSQEQVEKESQEEFKELLSQYQEATQAKQALEQGASTMQSEIEELKKELETQKSIADGKLSEEAERLLVVGFKDFEHELNRIAAKVFERRRMMLEANGETPEAQAEFRQVEERLGAIIQRLLAQQRELFFGAGGRYARDREVALLEKRLDKMYAQLQAMESALKALSSQKLLTNTHVQTILRGLGLLDDDKYAERRKGMLKVVFEQNVRLRQEIQGLRSEQTTAAAG